MRFSFAKNVIPVILKVGTIALAIWIIYHYDFITLGNAAVQNEQISYVLVIPLLIAYLIYRKRKMLRVVIASEKPALASKTTKTSEVAGAMLCLFAFLFYWHGSYTLHPPEYHLASLPLFVAGFVLLVFNAQTLRVLVFPIAFLFFIVPLPDEIVSAIGSTIAIYSSKAAYTVLRAIGLPVILTTQQGFPVLMLEKSGVVPLFFTVDMPSAGIYSFVGFTVFAVFFAFLARGAPWRRAIMLLAGFPLFYTLNIMRIIAMMLIGYRYGAEAATETTHIMEGWFLVFAGTFLVLLVVSETILKTEIFSIEPKAESCPSCSQSLEKKRDFCLDCGKLLRHTDIKISKRDLFKIAAIAVCVSLTAFLEVPAFALTNGNIQVTVRAFDGEKIDKPVIPEISGYTLQFGFSNETLEKMVGENVSLTYVYTSRDESKPVIWGTVEIANSSSLFNRQEIYGLRYITSRGELLNLRDAQLLQNPPISGKFVSLQSSKSNLTLTVLYWYERAIFDTGPDAFEKYVRISVFTFANNSSDYLKIEEENLLPVGQAIASYWEPPREWSWIASLIAQYGYALSFVVIVLLAVILTVQVIDLKREEDFNRKGFNKLVLEDEKFTLQAVHRAGKRGKSTANAIALSFHDINGESVEQNRLLEILESADQVGLVRKSIANEEDEPTLVWESLISFPNSNSNLQRIRRLIKQIKVLDYLKSGENS